MGKPVAEDENVYDLTTPQIAERIIAAFANMPGGAEALYILGSDWRVIDVMARLEGALQIPVLHPVMVRCWYIRRMLGLDDPVPGRGRLLAQMPALP
jgi:maleate cis-trans isomerase